MRGFLHLTERKKTNVVRLAHFFERPANAHVTRQSLAAIGRPFKGGDGGGHWKLRVIALRHADLIYPMLPDAETLIADKGYGSDAFREALVGRGIMPCIPPRAKPWLPATYCKTCIGSATKSRTCSHS